MTGWIATQAQLHSADEQLLELGAWRPAVRVWLWSMLAVVTGFPILNLMIKAGWTVAQYENGQNHYSWQLSRWFQTLCESLQLFRAELYWSMILGLMAASLALLITVGLYWWSSASSFTAATDGASRLLSPRRLLVHALMILLVAIPGPLVGELITWLMNRSNPAWLGRLYYESLAAPTLAQQFRLLPLSWLLLCASLSGIAQQTWQLAVADRLSKWEQVRSVIWPHARWLLAANLLLLILLSVGELSCSMAVLPPGVTTLSKRLFEILHFGMRHQDSGLCGIMILLSWIATSIWLLARRASS
jgi:iron(III) transport system permease protein